MKKFVMSSAGSAVKGFFTETVPAKFGELVDGVGGFFTETGRADCSYAATNRRTDGRSHAGEDAAHRRADTCTLERPFYKGGKALVNGAKAVGSAIGNVTGISDGFNIFVCSAVPSPSPMLFAFSAIHALPVLFHQASKGSAISLSQAILILSHRVSAFAHSGLCSGTRSDGQRRCGRLQCRHRPPLHPRPDEQAGGHDGGGKQRHGSGQADRAYRPRCPCFSSPPWRGFPWPPPPAPRRTLWFHPASLP